MLSQLHHALLDTVYNTPPVFHLADYSTALQVSGITPSTLALLPSLPTRIVRHSNYLLVFSTQRFGMLRLGHHSLLKLSDRLCFHPFGPQHRLTAYRLSTDGTCFRLLTESSLTQACLVGPLPAAVYRNAAIGYVTTLILNGR